MVRSLVCDRIRSYVSLDLDGELSVLERRMLDGHLERCVDCRAFAAETAAFTHTLRAAEVEVPRQAVRVGSRRRRRVASLRIAQGAAAAAVVLVAGGLGTALAPEQERRSAQRIEPSASALKLIDGHIQPALGPRPMSGPAHALTIAL